MSLAEGSAPGGSAAGTGHKVTHLVYMSHASPRRQRACPRTRDLVALRPFDFQARRVLMDSGGRLAPTDPRVGQGGSPRLPTIVDLGTVGAARTLPGGLS